MNISTTAFLVFWSPKTPLLQAALHSIICRVKVQPTLDIRDLQAGVSACPMKVIRIKEIVASMQRIGSVRVIEKEKAWPA